MNEERKPPQRLKKKRRTWKAPLMAAAMMVCMCLLIAPSIGTATRDIPVAVPTAAPTATPRPTPRPTPTPSPTPPPYDYAVSAAESDAVEMEYFADAVFIGDSRTDGLRLYSGIYGTTFFCYKGITVFDIMNRPDKKFVTVDETKYTVLEALALQQYAKVYISLGVNELGYHNDEGYAETYAAFLEKVRELQPNAIIYLQNLAPVNPDKCKANKQPYWVTNEQVNAYNKIYAQLAVDQKIVLVDVASALSDETGILPAEGTVDGIHFTKTWYQKWLAYLTTHTVPADKLGLGLV